MKQLVLIFALISLMTNSYAQMVRKQGGHCFTMEVPAYMKKTFDLSDAATLQYRNDEKEAYIMVIEDAKDHMESVGLNFDSPSAFLKNFTDDYLKDAKSRTLGAVTTFEQNGYKMAQTELTWSDDDGSYYMLITVTETAGHFYKTLCWTSSKNKQALKADFLAAAKSIKE